MFNTAGEGYRWEGTGMGTRMGEEKGPNNNNNDRLTAFDPGQPG